MNKRWQSGIIILAVVIVSILVFKIGLFNQLSDQFTDKLFIKKQANQNIVIVAIDDESLNAIGVWPWPREVFAKALNYLQESKAVGIDINFAEHSRLGEADDIQLAKALENLGDKIVLPIELGNNNKPVTEPLSNFSKTTSVGFVNIPLSKDGTTREAKISRGDYQSFDYLLASKIQSIKEGPNTFKIAYRGGPSTYLTFPFNDVLEGKIPANIFKDNIVLVGVTAPDLHDTLQTPFGPVSGVEVHANIIGTLIYGHYFKTIPEYFDYLIFILMIFGIFWGVRRFKSLIMLSISVIMILVLLYGISAYLFTQYIIVPTIYILFCLILSLITAVTFEYLTESKEKKFIRKAFQHYLSAELVDELVKNPQKLVLGGERRRVSILFSDIRSFTNISESMSPEGLTQFMGEYFGVVSDLILEEHGILDKYIGDAIMAFWGAPLANTKHAINACKVGLLMQDRVAKQNEIWKERGLPPIQIGVGINTGDVIVGNMGSKKRFNYGIVGDEVNLASRLEGLTKFYKVKCITSENTKKEGEKENSLFFRPLDLVLVKGKKEPRRLYELLGEKLNPECENNYLEGLEFYEKGDWQKAIESFNKVLQICPDGPSEVLLERSFEFSKNPPLDWKGVYEFKVK